MMLKTKFIKTLGIFIAATVLAGCSNTAGDKNNEEQVTENPRGGTGYKYSRGIPGKGPGSNRNK